MDKIRTLKIKNPDGTVGEETYTISVAAKDVDMANGKDLQDTVGNINVDRDGSIAYQLGKYKDYDSDIETLYDDVDDLNDKDTALENDIIDLQINKINKTDIVDNLDSTLNTKVLSAAQGKVLGDAVIVLEAENVKKKAYFFDTVADMKAANLKDGDYACTLGYYSVNDGGAAKYKIVNSSNSYYEELNNELKAELVIDQDTIDIKQMGAQENTDCSNIIQRALDLCTEVIIDKGTYIVTTPLLIHNSNILRGSKENTTIQFNGTGNCININGRYATVKDLKIIANTNIQSTDKVGIYVVPVQGTSENGTLTNIILESLYLRSFNKGISLDIMWQVTIRNCIIIGVGKGSSDNRNCFGISYENSGRIISNWSGSGNIIESCCIESCSYGLHIVGGWNVTSIDTIIENCYCSIYNYNSNRTLIINNWFEANEIQPELQSELIMIGGRKNTLVNSSVLEFPNDLNNLHLIYSGGDTINKYNQKLMSNIVNEEAILTGIKSVVPTSGNTKITSLKAFTSRGQVVKDGNISDNNLTGEVAIVAYGTAGGTAGKTYTNLQYNSGQTDGNNIDIALRTVFNVDKDGGITNPSSNDAVDIGSSGHKYKFVWCRNVIVKGDDNNYYKLGVDSSGNPKATRV